MAVNTTEWKQSLRVGEIGEMNCWNYFINRKKVRNIVDVRHDKRYQQEDVDFLVENTDRQWSKVEVKTDTQAHDTNNIAYELTTNKQIGCFAKTKADWVFYYLTGNGEAYLISVSKIRKFLKKRVYDYVYMGNNASGYLIPIDELLSAKVMVKVYELPS